MSNSLILALIGAIGLIAIAKGGDVTDNSNCDLTYLKNGEQKDKCSSTDLLPLNSTEYCQYYCKCSGGKLQVEKCLFDNYYDKYLMECTPYDYVCREVDCKEGEKRASESSSYCRYYDVCFHGVWTQHKCSWKEKFDNQKLTCYSSWTSWLPCFM